jgi:CxxC motif-containing protein (DUF1111 family)
VKGARFVRLLGALAVVAAACGTAPDGLVIRTDDGTDLPLRGATAEQKARFAEGDARFDLVFREADGLGPLYVRPACASCHAAAGRGPGAVQKMAVVGADGVTPSEDQSLLAYGHTVRPFKTAGATQALSAPVDPRVKLSLRVGPAVFGRGYLEAIDGAELERVQAEQATRSDGIHGRINRVVHHSEWNPASPYDPYRKGDAGLVGRFGVKARGATLDDFTADALQGDMGLTSPLRPTEPPNPDGLTDDGRPGVDVDLSYVNAVADYLRLLEIPRRTPPVGNGAQLFSLARCDVCHVPSLRTRADYPLALLAGRDAPVYSDLLLHDLGEGLADGVVDETATSREWRTAPLIGLRFSRDFLHDGRATTLEETILAHASPGSEANDSVRRFQGLSDGDRQALVDFVHSL